MMLHDKILPGQFFLDMKNDFNNSLLNGNPPQNKLDTYGAYNFLNHHHHHHHKQQQRLSPHPADGEVLDLSRRCDSVETRKTPSPYNSTSSFGTASPSTQCGSPTNSTKTQTSTSPSVSSTQTVPAGLIPNKMHFPKTSPPPMPQGIASLYPLYYSNIKQEVVSPPPPPAVPIITNSLPLFPTMNCITPSAAYTNHKLDDQKNNSQYSRLADAANILYPNILNAATTGTINSAKATRPFNAYPRDPMQVAAHFAASDVMLEKTRMERYSVFRKRALNDLRDTNGGHRVVTNPKMRRTNNRNNGQNSECEERAVESSDNDSSTGNGSSVENSNKNDTNNDSESNMNFGGGVKDEAYYERRRKNNAAAKKSRDRRRIKEDEIAIRAAYLERQNIELLCQIDALKKQLEIYTKA